jgi:hypothetical protein
MYILLNKEFKFKKPFYQSDEIEYYFVCRKKSVYDEKHYKRPDGLFAGGFLYGTGTRV